MKFKIFIVLCLLLLGAAVYLLPFDLDQSSPTTHCLYNNTSEVCVNCYKQFTLLKQSPVTTYKPVLEMNNKNMLIGYIDSCSTFQCADLLQLTSLFGGGKLELQSTKETEEYIKLLDLEVFQYDHQEVPLDNTKSIVTFYHEEIYPGKQEEQLVIFYTDISKIYIALSIETILLLVAFGANMLMVRKFKDVYPIPVVEIGLIIIKSTIISSILIYEWMRDHPYSQLVEILKFLINSLTYFGLVFIVESRNSLKFLIMFAISFTTLASYYGSINQEKQHAIIIGISILVFLIGIRKQQQSKFNRLNITLASVILILFAVSEYVIQVNKAVFFNFLNIYVIILGLLFIQPIIIKDEIKHIQLVEQPSGTFQSSTHADNDSVNEGQSKNNQI